MTAYILPMGIPGWTQILLVVVVILLLFGAKKIPEMMRGMGRGVKEFKDAVGKDYPAEEAEVIEETAALPPKKAPAKKTVAKKPVAKKSTAKKPAAPKK